MKIRLWMAGIFSLVCLVSYARTEKTDTLAVSDVKEKSDRNVLLNATEASVPRELNMGFADTGKGAVVGINGMKHAITLPGRSQYHWAGGNAFEPIGTYSLVESASLFGEISIMMDSRARFGGEVFSGAFTGMTSSNGLIRFDGAVNGPIDKAKGWYFSGSAYVNMDPTNVNSPSRRFIDNKQIFMGTLSKRWRKSSLNFIYSLAFNRDCVEGGYAQAPFLYNGDGSIRALDGFRIGRDSYMPVDETVSYMNVTTGKMVNEKVSDNNFRRIHDFYAIFKHTSDNGWNIDLSGHFLYMPVGDCAIPYVKGIDSVSAGAGYTYADGTPFTGMMQNRMVTSDETRGILAQIHGKVEKKLSHHKLIFGFQPYYNFQYKHTSSYVFAHTVAANPARIYKDGRNAWAFNTNAALYDCDAYSLPLYMYDEWVPTDRWLLRTGARVSPTWYVYRCYTEQPDGLNKRVDGFNIADPSLAKEGESVLSGAGWVFSEHASYRIAGRLFALAEGFVSSTPKSPQFFANPKLPATMTPIINAFGSVGLMYDNAWLELNALFTFITNWNSTGSVQVSKKLATGVTETIPYTSLMGIKTPGITLDGNIHFGGFKLHTLVTWQDPKYKDYRCEFNFSDGSTQVIDYTGKFVTGISQWLVEFDPSYQWERVRLWGSLRYNSRQYACRSNVAYFNGHFETFAGADINVDKHSKISLSIVNLLNQDGAKGSIPTADTVTDASELQSVLMAGTYIRPLSVELGYTYRF